MKRTNKLICVLLALVFVLTFALTACKDSEPTASTPGNGGSQPAPSQPADSKPADSKPAESQPSDSKPADPSADLEITVTPAELEIYAGEEIDLMFGVSVNNAEASLRISDDNDFDYETPGTYTITYEAALGDVKVNATRTIVVLQAKSNLAVEVTFNHLGDKKWPSLLMSFPNAMYIELNADTELSAQSGVFKNVSDQPIVLNVGGSYGCSAIINANGVVLEGRDGANSKLVNAENPSRTSSSVTTMVIGEETVSVSSAFAKMMTIPAGGYAIVVQPDTFGTGADADGRGFMNYNVIREIGNVVRLYWVDSGEELTTYVNQQPAVTGNNKVLAQMGNAEFDLNTAILAGLTAKDDNGTFSLDDDIVIDTITIVNDGGFNINEVGTYVVTLSVTDGELTTEFTREVEVKSEGIGTIYVGENKMNVSMELVAIDQELTATGKFAFIIYTPNYTGGIDYANGWGEAFVVDAYGVIVRIYDGANGKYYDAENAGGIVDSSKCTPAGYLTEAFASLQEGETLIVAPNGGDNNAAGGSRTFMNKNKVIGATISGLGLSFKTTSTIITIGDKTFEAEEGKWLYNGDVDAAAAANYSILIFDKNYTGNVAINGYGAAFVLNQYGNIVKFYDAANVAFYTQPGVKGAAHFTAANYATVAFEELQEGEILVIFPNDGAGNVARGWALGLRGLDGKDYFNQVASITGFTFEKKEG